MPMPVPDVFSPVASVPFHFAYLDVGAGHRVYFVEYGNPAGPAAVVLHGGPGSRCHTGMLEWFDLSVQRVVLFDQRGAGRSLPAGEIAHNRTADLLADMERLRQHLHIVRWMVTGGSWGATLATLYAGAYPERVCGLVLRGTFLASQREMRWFFQELRALVPYAWSQLTQGWSQHQKNNVLQNLTVLLRNGTIYQKQDSAMRWERYEEAVMRAMTGKQADATPSDPAPRANLNKYLLQAHYLAQGCFTQERSVFRAARNTAQFPVILLHGTHDWICPPENAWRLQRFMPWAEIRWIDGATHTPADPAIAAGLRQAIHDLLKNQSLINV